MRISPEITKELTDEQLEMGLLTLRCRMDHTEDDGANIKVIQDEIGSRAGQPIGEIHLTVLKGERGKAEDFSVTV